MAEVKLNNDQRSTLDSPSQRSIRETADPVVTGRVSIQKETIGEKIKKRLMPGDIQDIKKYAINQIIIPGIKNGTLALLEMAFFGSVTKRSQSTSQPQRTNYTYFSSSQKPIQHPQNIRPQNLNNFRNVTFESYQDAEDVISTLLDILDRAGEVTVADLYDICGLNVDWPAENWGWKSFSRLEPRAIRGGGYVLDIQQPTRLR